MKKFFKAFGIAAIYFGIYFVIQFIVGIIFVLILMIYMTVKMIAETGNLDVDLLASQGTDQIMQNAMLMLIISGIIYLIVLWIIFLVRKKKFLKEVTISKINIKNILPILLLGVSLNLVISGAMALIPFPQSWVEAYMESYSTTEGGNVVIAIIATVILAPIVEEITFRGLIYARLKKGMPIVVAAIISSLVFALMHTSLIWASYAFILGIILVWIFERFKSLTANILVHFFFNLTGVLLGYVTEIPDALGWIIIGVSVFVLVSSVIWIKKITRTEEFKVKVIRC